jgi:hypothetical protein
MELSPRANMGLSAYLRSRRDGPSCAPEDIKDPYYSLGSHPDLVARLWDEVTVKLPQDCRWIVCGTPALVHPDTRIVFAFCEGTHTYAFRLPPAQHEAALKVGAKRIWIYQGAPQSGIPSTELNLDDIGPEWVFCGWLKGEEDWCLAAYEWVGGDRSRD